MREGNTEVVVNCKDNKCIYNDKEGICINKTAIRNVPPSCKSAYCDSCAKVEYNKKE